MEPAALLFLIGNILAFKNAALLVESEIKHHDEIYPFKIDSYEHLTDKCMWESMKTVSHFNLGIALELMLKMILLRNGKSLKEIFKKIKAKERHHLAVLYGYLPEEEQKMLNSKFDEISERKLISEGKRITFLAPSIPGKKDGPFEVQKNRLKRTNGLSLIDLLTDLDKECRFSEKRYDYEAVEKREWCRYLDDISAFTELIDCVLEPDPLTPAPRLRKDSP